MVGSWEEPTCPDTSVKPKRLSPHSPSVFSSYRRFFEGTLHLSLMTTLIGISTQIGTLKVKTSWVSSTDFGIASLSPLIFILAHLRWFRRAVSTIEPPQFFGSLCHRSLFPILPFLHDVFSHTVIFKKSAAASSLHSLMSTPNSLVSLRIFWWIPSNFMSNGARSRGSYNIEPWSMTISIVSWNVRGLNQTSKRCIIKTLIRGWKADVYRF